MRKPNVALEIDRVTFFGTKYSFSLKCGEGLPQVRTPSRMTRQFSWLSPAATTLLQVSTRPPHLTACGRYKTWLGLGKELIRKWKALVQIGGTPFRGCAVPLSDDLRVTQKGFNIYVSMEHLKNAIAGPAELGCRKLVWSDGRARVMRVVILCLRAANSIGIMTEKVLEKV